ncbi:MAG: hypothetical protein EPN62_00190 [Candidimonas sp.]|nr:MAG: hypothetical protein EPN62_00190 [Candidimonas sp.]
MTSVFYSQDPSERYPCTVKIDGDEISVEYDDDGPASYRGQDLGGGHYILERSKGNGKATLHRSPDDPDTLEGSWVEAGARGMWRIELQDMA